MTTSPLPLCNSASAQSSLLATGLGHSLSTDDQGANNATSAAQGHGTVHAHAHAYAYEAMLSKVGAISSCTKRAFIITSALYLSAAAAAFGYLNYQQDVTKLDLGSPTIAISLEQFGDLSQPEPAPAPEPEPLPEPEPPQLKPEPIIDEQAPAVAPPKVVKRERHIERQREMKRRPPVEHQKPKHVRKRQQEVVNPAATNAPTKTRANPHAKSRAAEQVLILGRDQHPVLSKIKQAIDSNLMYPRRARMMREQGVAIVQFTYTKQGQIKRLRLLRSSGSQELDSAAKQTILRASASFPQVNQDFALRLPIVFKLTN